MQLPEDFKRETKLVMGDERFDRFMGAFDEEAPVSIRLNPRLHTPHSTLHTPHSTLLTPQENIPWCEEGYYLAGRPQFTFDPLFHAGCYYVQEAASMFVTHIIRSVDIPSPKRALDLCAAPGGKSTALLSVLPDDCTLVSNEPISNRAQILLENITKWGYPNSIVTNNYPRDFRKAKLTFDLILCDVPCSGEGMFRKDPATIGEWSLQNVEKCWRLQREIVADAWECLAPGGLLIYSTCTFNLKENEENVRWILGNFDAEVLDIPIDPSWNITGSLLEGFTAPVYRFIPGITRSEGLFICAIRKRGGRREDSFSRKEERGRRNENTVIKEKLEKIKFLKVLDPSDLLPPSSFLLPRISIDYPEALKYLRGEALVLPADTPRGIVNIAYKGIVLGAVKNIGNRANNLYPKAWRIRTTHLPTEEVKIIDIQ